MSVWRQLRAVLLLPFTVTVVLPALILWGGGGVDVDLDLVSALLGSALIRTGHRRDGMVLVEKAAKQGNSPEAYLLAGQMALKMNLFERGGSQRVDLKLRAGSDEGEPRCPSRPPRSTPT